MRGFGEELRDLAERLDLPQPMRSRILLELSADLADLASALEAEGVGRVEARRRALDVLFPSGEALRELERLHRPLYRRLVDRFSEPARHGLERALLTVLALMLGGFGAWLLAGAELLRDPTPFLWPVLVVGALVLGMGGGKLFQLYVKKDHDRARLGRGMWGLPVAGAAAAVLGFGGAVADLYVVAGAVAGSPDRAALELLRWLRQDMALLSVALLIVSAAGLLWLSSAVGIARVEQAEAMALGLLDTSTEGE